MGFYTQIPNRLTDRRSVSLSVICVHQSRAEKGKMPTVLAPKLPLSLLFFLSLQLTYV